MHSAVPLLLNLPSGHAKHFVDPVSVDICPAAQSVHFAAASPANFPGEHFAHLLNKAELVPATHMVHFVDPATETYPLAQGVQLLAP